MGSLRREDFGDWGITLFEEDFWRALAIAGAAEFDVNLTNRHEDGLHLQWITPQQAPKLSTDFCLQLWHKLVESRYGRPRLALTVSFDNHAEVTRNFLDSDVASLYHQLPLQSPGLRWRWPLRIGFLMDDASQQVCEAIRARRDEIEQEPFSPDPSVAARP